MGNPAQLSSCNYKIIVLLQLLKGVIGIFYRVKNLGEIIFKRELQFHVICFVTAVKFVRLPYSSSAPAIKFLKGVVKRFTIAY